MTQLEDMLAFLGSNATDGYGPSPIPSKIDDEVRALIAAIAQADASLQSTIVSLMVERHGFVLIAFAERMSSLAVRKQDARLIVEGLEALSLASHVIYFKEVLPIVSLLYRSVKKLGADPAKILSSVPQPGTPFQELLDEYLQRDEKDRSIEVMDYVESKDDAGFRYARTW